MANSLHAASFSAAACPDEKSSKVLRAATAIFLQHGFSAATTDMIQREAGVSKATVYACFPNKEALFAAVIASECAALTAQVQSIREDTSSLERSLTEIGMAYLSLVLTPAGLALYRVVIAEAPRFPALGRLFYTAGPRVMAGIVERHLQAAVDAGRLNLQSVGTGAAATLFVGLLRNEGQLECLTHPESLPSTAQIERWVSLAVGTFLRAYAPAGS